MFIKTNDRVVSLKNVSNINILKREKRIVFNLNYSIEINEGEFYPGHYTQEIVATDVANIVTDLKPKLISDYVYWDFVGEADFENALQLLDQNQYIKDNYIIHFKGYVNKNEISSIKFSDKKLRVIFNLSHPVTFTDYNRVQRVTSEFVYVDFRSRGEYTNMANDIKSIII